MNEIKRRKKGFLGLVLAVVMILGIPGGNLLAAEYWFCNQCGPAGIPELTPGTTVNNGDMLYRGSGNMIINYPGGNVDNNDNGSTTIVGGPYVVASVQGTIVTLTNPATTPTTPTTPVVVVTSQNQSTDFYGDYLEELAKLIKRIRRPGGEVHTFGSGDSLTYGVLKALADNPEDVLVFTTTYKNVKYTFTIQGGDYINNLITPEIPWYGPLWLAQNFYQTTVFEPAT